MAQYRYDPWRFLKVGIALLFCIGAISTCVYRVLGHYYGKDWTWTDCLFMVVITLSTIGYGDWLELKGKPLAMFYTMFLGLAGIGVPAFVIATTTALIVDGTFGFTIRRRRMQKDIARISGHFIICGAGGLGVHAIEEMLKTNQKIVVIDRDSARLLELNQLLGEFPFIVGSAEHDETLKAAGIERAHGMLVCLTEDKDNLFVTLSAKALNPNLRISCKAIDGEVRKKMLIAGAISVVSPTEIGGMRMVSEMLRPATVNFLDSMLRDRTATRFGELEVKRGSAVLGKTLAAADLRHKADVLVVAARRRGEETFVYNPKADFMLEDGCMIVVLGAVAEIDKLKEVFEGATK